MAAGWGKNVKKITFFQKRPQEKSGLKKKSPRKKKNCGRAVGAKLKTPTGKVWARSKKKKLWAEPTLNFSNFWRPQF